MTRAGFSWLYYILDRNSWQRTRSGFLFLITCLAFILALPFSQVLAQPEIEVRANSTLITTPDTTPSLTDSTDFGSVGVGNSKTTSYFVLNNGTTDLTLTIPVITGTNAGEFTIVQNPVSPVSASGQTDFAITFSPAAAGQRTATVIFANNDSDENLFTFDIQGTGTASPASFTITSGNNQSAVINTQFANPLVATVLDVSNNPIQGITINFTPPDQGGGLVPGATLSQTTLATDANGQVSVNATANSLAGSYQVKATLLGFAEIDFDLTNTSTDVTAPRIVSITRHDPAVENTSADSLVWRITFDEPVQNVNGGVGGDFTVAGVSGGNVTLTPVSTSVYDVTITGGNLPSLNGTVTMGILGAQNIADFAGNALSNTAPTGTNNNFFTVSNAGAPEIRVNGSNSTEIAFGATTTNITNGTNFGAVPILSNVNTDFFIINTGTTDLTVGTVSITGSADFSITFVPSSPVGSGSQFTTLQIRYAPTSVGLATATVTIPNNDSDENPFTFVIQGTGTGSPEIKVGGNASIEIVSGDTSPNTADGTDLGSTTVGSTSTNTTFFISNTFGNLLLTLGTVTITGADAADFNIVSAPANNVAPAGAFTTLVISFSPSAAGLRTATINIPNNDPDENPYTFAIQGTGLNLPDIRISGDGLLPVLINGPELTDGQTATSVATGTDFGDQIVGSYSLRFQFGLTNTAPNSLLTTGPNALTFSGPAAADFSVVGASNRRLGTNASTAFDITFVPSALGARNATIHLVSNDPDESPFTFNITGNGIAGPVDNIVISSGNGQSQTINTAFGAPVIATLTDSGGNPVAGTTVNFTTPGTGASATLSAASGVTDAAGQVSVNATANATTGAYDITFSSVGVTNATATLTNTVGTASTLSLISGTPQTTPLSASFNDPLVARITDSGGNPIAGATVNFAAPGAGASATLSALSAVTNANGDATVSATANNTQGTYNIVASSAGLTNVSFVLTNRIGPSVDETQAVIADFMLNRANHIIANQPDFISFLDGTSTTGGGTLGKLSLEANQQNMTLAFSTSRSKILATNAQNRIEQAFASAGDRLETGDKQSKQAMQIAGSTNDIQIGKAGSYDIWTEIYGTNASSGPSDSRLWVGYLGAHYFVDDNTLIGVMGQFDWADETNASLNSQANGTGWMVGPYVAGRIPGGNLSYELRAAWGKSRNDVSPDGTFVDEFETERWLLSAKLAGLHKYDSFTIKPQVRFSWFEETQQAYNDSLAQLIPEQTISLGELKFGAQFIRDIVLENGVVMKPSLGTFGIWNFDIRDNNASQGFPIGDDDLRGRIDAGLSATSPNGLILKIGGYYDGLGASDYSALGFNAKLSIPLN